MTLSTSPEKKDPSTIDRNDSMRSASENSSALTESRNEKEKRAVKREAQESIAELRHEVVEQKSTQELQEAIDEAEDVVAKSGVDAREIEQIANQAQQASKENQETFLSAILKMLIKLLKALSPKALFGEKENEDTKPAEEPKKPTIVKPSLESKKDSAKENEFYVPTGHEQPFLDEKSLESHAEQLRARVITKKRYAELLSWYISWTTEERFDADEIEGCLEYTDNPQPTEEYAFHNMFACPYMITNKKIADAVTYIDLNYLELEQMWREAHVTKEINGRMRTFSNKENFQGKPLRPLGYRRPFTGDETESSTLRMAEDQYKIKINPEQVLYVQNFVDTLREEYIGLAVQAENGYQSFFVKVSKPISAEPKLDDSIKPEEEHSKDFSPEYLERTGAKLEADKKYRESLRPVVKEFREKIKEGDKKEYAQMLSWYIYHITGKKFEPDRIEGSLQYTENPKIQTGIYRFHDMYANPFDITDKEIFDAYLKIGIDMDFFAMRHMYREANEGRFGGEPLQPTGFKVPIDNDTPVTRRILKKVAEEYDVKINHEDVMYIQKLYAERRPCAGIAAKVGDEFKYFIIELR